ncbi:MAG: hypothetical protein ACFFG0_03100 [Candidatus Thorarchaeota archaeon]
MTETKEIIKEPVVLGAGTFIAVALVGITYILAHGTPYYICYDTEPPIIGQCYELTDSSIYGENVNCKYNESNPRQYKRCVSGWVLFENKTTIGNPVEIPDGNEYDIELPIAYDELEVNWYKNERTIFFEVLNNGVHVYSNEFPYIQCAGQKTEEDILKIWKTCRDYFVKYTDEEIELLIINEVEKELNKIKIIDVVKRDLEIKHIILK